MTQRTRPRRFHVERLESRQVLAATVADYTALVSDTNTFDGDLPVWQRTASAVVVQDARGLPAYDLRTNLPGDQTLRLESDVTNVHGTQVWRLGERLARVLVNPQAVYEVNSLAADGSSGLFMDAYDIFGRSLGRFSLGMEDDPRTADQSSQMGWHRGYLGDPGDRSALFMQLPLQTYVIEVEFGLGTTLGFVGDSLEGGAQIVRWQDSRSHFSNRTVDLVESDQAYSMLPGRTYHLDATVHYQGTSPGVAHSVGYTAYDRDGQRIEFKHVARYGSAADTTLIQDLKPGDTFFDLADASGWSKLAGPETRALAWYGYTDSTGQVYADYTYTRNVVSHPLGAWQADGVVGNRIHLRVPWSGPRVQAGTAVRNAVDEPGGSIFPVLANYAVAPITARATVHGVWKNGLSDPKAFPPGTATFRPAAELNLVTQLNGFAELSYRLSTNPSSAVSVDVSAHTRSAVLDVLANDPAATGAAAKLVSVSTPRYGVAQLVPETASSRAQIRYTTAAYFVGTDQFTYTVELANGQRVTESVTVDSLGGNLDAYPSLQQRLQQANALPTDEIREYGSSFVAVSGVALSSTADSVNSMKISLQPGSIVSYGLIKGVAHGTLQLNADGTFIYQSDAGFVGTEVFEYEVSNGQRAVRRIGSIQVVDSVDEADRFRVASIALAMNSFQSSFRRLFYSNLPQYFDASGAPLVSWRVHLLPFLGYADLYARFKLDEPWNSPNNLALLDQMPDIYRSMRDTGSSSTTRFHAIKAATVNSPTEHFLSSNGSPRIARYESIFHGTSNTLMFVRSGGDRAVPWTKPDDLAFDNTNPLSTLGTITEDVIPVSFADTTAALMPKDILAATFTSIATVQATPGVDSVDGPTLRRAWSEKLNQPSVHAQKYHALQQENLRDLGQAVYNYHDAFRRLPPWGATDAVGNRLLSWRVLLLPYMGHAELYNRFRLNEAWDSPHNLSLLGQMPDIFRSAGDAANSTSTRLRVLSGTGTLYDPALSRSLTISNVQDGLHDTLFAIEAGIDQAVPWTMPETLPLGPDFLRSAGQLTDGVLRGLLVSGTPISIPLSTPNTTLQAMATYRSGELVNYTWPEAAQATYNLRNISWASLQFVQTYRRLPQNFWGDSFLTKKTTSPTLSWRVALLPFLDEYALYNQFRFDEPWDSPYNLSLLPYMPEVYRSHGLDPKLGLTRMQIFSGARTVLKPDGTAVRSSDIHDGTSATLSVVEAGLDQVVPWTKPSDLDGEVIDLWKELGLVGQTFTAAIADGGARSFSRGEQRYLINQVIRNDGGLIQAFDSTEQIVIREGQITAIDLPTATFTVENPAVVQLGTSSFSHPDYLTTRPTRVTIAAINNSEVDGLRVFQLHYNGRTVQVFILDDEGLNLTADPTTISEAGGRVTFTVKRPTTDTQSPLDIQINSSHPARLSVPAFVVIPAGESSATFEGLARDNATAMDSESIRVTVAAAGMGVGMVDIRVIDDESLLLSFAPNIISEAGGVAIGTLTRRGDVSQPLVVSLTHDQPGKANLPQQVIIPAGQLSVAFEASAIDDSIYNESRVVHVVASATGFGDVLGSFTIQDFEEIGLAFSQNKISEANETVTLTVTRTADSQGQPLLVQLKSDRPDKVELPESVIIPANAQRASVQLRTLDNRLLDGLVQVHVTAWFGPPEQTYAAGIAGLDVADHEALSITLTPPTLSEKDQTAVGRLTRSNTDWGMPLTVALVASHEDLVAIPATVTIPAGAEYVEFSVDTRDNDQLAPDTRVRLDAIHPAYLPEHAMLTVTDYEPLSLTLSATSGREGTTLTGTVTRNHSNLDQPTTVLLTSTDTGEARVPEGVVIPAGQRSVSFAIELLRDRISDGPQIARISADSAGYVGTTSDVTVIDHEFITVLLVQNGPLDESSGVVLARLTRSDWNSEFPLTIQVSSDNPSLAYPGMSTLQIEAHQTSIEFPVYIVDDTAVESTQAVQLTFDVMDAALEDATLDLLIADNDNFSWHNSANPLDVNRNGSVTPLDALLVINYLNRFGPRPVGSLPDSGSGQPVLVDTSNDQQLSALDALLVINFINRNSAGEAELVSWGDLATPFATDESLKRAGSQWSRLRRLV